MKASDVLYATGGVLFLGGLWGLRRALTVAGRTVDRLIAPRSVDCLPAASENAWVGTAAVPEQRGGERR